MATTHASTRTVTRIRLLKTQISRALRKTTDISEERLNRLLFGVDQRWLQKFSIYAFDNKHLCHAKLDLIINWDEHNAQISAGKATVSIDGKWTNDVAIEVDEATRAFKEFVDDFGFHTEWFVSYTSSVYGNPTLLDRVKRELGLKTADPVKWAGRRIGTKFTVPELSELDIELSMVEDG